MHSIGQYSVMKTASETKYIMKLSIYALFIVLFIYLSTSTCCSIKIIFAYISIERNGAKWVLHIFSSLDKFNAIKQNYKLSL